MKNQMIGILSSFCLLGPVSPADAASCGAKPLEIRTVAEGGTIIELNDGSCLANLQVVVDANVPRYQDLIKDVTTGAGIAVIGEIKDSPGSRQRVEVHARSLRVLGTADAQTYPLQKKQHSFEFLREIAHAFK